MRGAVSNRIQWPDGKAFAFTIFDDTDFQTVENVGPVYSLLSDLGFRTTKSVWPLRGNGTPVTGGDTCEDEKYLRWVLDLHEKGFRSRCTTRPIIRRRGKRPCAGLRLSTGCSDTIHTLWRIIQVAMRAFTGALSSFWNSTTGIRPASCNETQSNIPRTRGRQSFILGRHLQGKSEVCAKLFLQLMDTLKACPFMPYHDPERPYAGTGSPRPKGRPVNGLTQCSVRKTRTGSQIPAVRALCTRTSPVDSLTLVE